MTEDEHEFYILRVADYIEVGIALDIARKMAEDDLELWRENRHQICTCVWSPVNTKTVDPPHMLQRDPDCPRHGDDADFSKLVETDETWRPTWGPHGSSRRKKIESEPTDFSKLGDEGDGS